MTTRLERSLHEAEEHLLRAEAEMARAAKILQAAKTSDDPQLSQLADVISTHRHLVGHLATITCSTFYANLQPEPALRHAGRRQIQAV